MSARNWKQAAADLLDRTWGAARWVGLRQNWLFGRLKRAPFNADEVQAVEGSLQQILGADNVRRGDDHHSVWGRVSDACAVGFDHTGISLEANDASVSEIEASAALAMVHAKQMWDGKCYVNPALPEEVKNAAWKMAQLYGVEINYKPSRSVRREIMEEIAAMRAAAQGGAAQGDVVAQEDVNEVPEDGMDEPQLVSGAEPAAANAAPEPEPELVSGDASGNASPEEELGTAQPAPRRSRSFSGLFQSARTRLRRNVADRYDRLSARRDPQPLDPARQAPAGQSPGPRL